MVKVQNSDSYGLKRLESKNARNAIIQKLTDKLYHFYCIMYKTVRCEAFFARSAFGKLRLKLVKLRPLDLVLFLLPESEALNYLFMK